LPNSVPWNAGYYKWTLSPRRSPTGCCSSAAPQDWATASTCRSTHTKGDHRVSAAECRGLASGKSRCSAPTGYDAALLHGASLIKPAIAERVYDTFADILTGPGAAVAQLAATAKLLWLIDHGDHPDRAVPLHRHARSILAACFPETSLPEDGPRRG
jgi:hypothetical protein